MVGIEKRLLELAEHLCKHPIEAVRLREPVWLRADGVPMSGASYKTRTGAAVLDINPGVDVWRTFLHECGHVRAHWNILVPGDYWKANPGTLRLTPSGRGLKSTPSMESEADRWVKTWSSYAARYAYIYLRDTVFESRWACLLEWPKWDVKAALEYADEQLALEAARRA